MRRALVLLTGAALVAAAAATAIGAADARTGSAIFTVPCADTIGNLSNPGGTDRRLALGVLSVPSAATTLGSTTVPGSWRYWSKAVVAVRKGNARVTISVPEAWRSKLAVVWGNRAVILPKIRFSICNDATTPSWSAYAGGLYLRQHVACVPLVVGDGKRTTTVRVAIDGTCP